MIIKGRYAFPRTAVAIAILNLTNEKVTTAFAKQNAGNCISTASSSPSVLLSRHLEFKMIHSTIEINAPPSRVRDVVSTLAFAQLTILIVPLRPFHTSAHTYEYSFLHSTPIRRGTPALLPPSLHLERVPRKKKTPFPTKQIIQHKKRTLRPKAMKYTV